MSTSVDATATAAWTRLGALHDAMRPDLRAWFADDPGRDFSPSSFAQVHAETRDFLLSRPAEVLRQLAARGH